MAKQSNSQMLLGKHAVVFGAGGSIGAAVAKEFAIEGAEVFHENEKLIVNPMVDGFWYWLFRGQPHYGRFTEFRRPGRIRHTWMSRKTLGEETMVTVTFQKKGEGTLMTLVHSGLTSDDMGQAHEKAWNFILGNFAEIFGSGAHRRK